MCILPDFVRVPLLKTRFENQARRSACWTGAKQSESVGLRQSRRLAAKKKQLNMKITNTRFFFAVTDKLWLQTFQGHEPGSDLT
jgi:hypothetical protein